MKLSRSSFCILTGLAMALSSQAQPVTQFDWKFSVSGRTNAPTEVISNPSGADATATILGSLNTYYSGTVPGGLFGTRTGLWDIGNGSVMLGVSLGAVSAVEFTLKVVQFVDDFGLYPATVWFSSPTIPGFTTASAISSTRTVVEQKTGSMVGYWVQDTYQWSALGAPGPIRLDVTPGSGSGGAGLYDEIELTIKGDLTSAPEPGCLHLLALGMGALVLRFRSQRKSS